MDLSIPPKAHGMEDHAMIQMTRIRGGIEELNEYWIEQYHQTGYKYDMKYRNMPNELAKAMVRARRGKASMNNDVIKAKQKKQEKHTGKRKANAVKLDIKEEKRKKELSVDTSLGGNLVKITARLQLVFTCMKIKMERGQKRTRG